MSNRVVRVQELIQREISGYLRKHYAQEMVAVTVSGVFVTPDFDEGRVLISVIGDEATAAKKLSWLRRHGEEIRREVGRHVILRKTPHFTWVLDETPARVARIESLLATIDRQLPPDAPAVPPADAAASPPAGA